MKKLKWVILITFIILFIIILLSLNSDFLLKIDNIIYRGISKYDNPTLTSIMKFITNFGDAIIISLITIILLIFLKSIKCKIVIFLNLITITLINQILKIIIRRPRPTINPLVIENSFSFPSGHSMVSFGFYGFLIFLIYHNIKNKKLKWLLITINSILILLIGISRIYLGVHYFSDVCGGFLLGMISLIILITIYKRWEYYEE